MRPTLRIPTPPIQPHTHQTPKASFAVQTDRPPAISYGSARPLRSLWRLYSRAKPATQMVGAMSTQTDSALDRPARPAPWRLKSMFWLDAILLVSICALQTLHFTGLILHEWLGLAVVPLILVHLLFAWGWITAQTRRFFTSCTTRSRINYLLNLSLFAAVTAATYSGILISQQAIPALTRSRPAPYMNWKWDKLHSDFSAIVVILVGLHLAVNWDWVLAAVQRIFRQSLRGRS